MVETVAHATSKAQLTGLEAFLTQFPSVAVFFGDAATFLYAHHVVEAMVFEPADEARPTESAVGKHHGTHTLWQCPNDGQEGVLLELVLAPIPRQTVAVVGQLQKRQSTPLTRNSYAQNLVAQPFSRRQRGVEHSPIDSQPQPPRIAKTSDGVPHEG